MPNWNDILDEIQKEGSTHDIVRRKYLKNLNSLTGRNIIIYYSGWLQKPNLSGVGINDHDKIGLMSTINNLDRSKGLDLILYTPGGEMAATESIVDYLRKMFDINIRAIIPQLAMSSGTMIACSCKSILMGKQSSLGPIDPQYRGLPAHGVIEEFEKAYRECRADPTKIHIWQPIIAKYSPTLIGECKKAIDWSIEIVKEWLLTGMLKDNENPNHVADNIINELGNHPLTKSHEHHLPASKCAEMGLNIEFMEDDQKLQDGILSLHHSVTHTLSATPAFKIIENHDGVAFIQQARQSIIK
jgi:ATP-dependent protease ClpP protease subunit